MAEALRSYSNWRKYADFFAVTRELNGTQIKHTKNGGRVANNANERGAYIVDALLCVNVNGQDLQNNA